MQSQQDAGRLPSQDIIARAHGLQSSAYQSSAPYPPGFEHVGPQPSGLMYAASAAQVAGMKRAATEASVPFPAPAPKKTRTRRKRNAHDVTGQPPVTSTMETASRALVPVEDPQYPTPLRSQIEPDFEAVSQRARELSAANRKARQPQVRSPWVQPDISRLILAVHEYKCRWSAIERAIRNKTIEFDRFRDQQALRDKARLLKQDFLK